MCFFVVAAIEELFVWAIAVVCLNALKILVFLVIPVAVVAFSVAIISEYEKDVSTVGAKILNERVWVDGFIIEEIANVGVLRLKANVRAFGVRTSESIRVGVFSARVKAWAAGVSV